jgi:hypothetical protein
MSEKRSSFGDDESMTPAERREAAKADWAMHVRKAVDALDAIDRLGAAYWSESHGLASREAQTEWFEQMDQGVFDLQSSLNHFERVSADVATRLRMTSP